MEARLTGIQLWISVKKNDQSPPVYSRFDAALCRPRLLCDRVQHSGDGETPELYVVMLSRTGRARMTMHHGCQRAPMFGNGVKVPAFGRLAGHGIL
jgi:hypothetical protein